MNNRDLPEGFSMALMQNERARAKFNSLSDREQKLVAERSKSISTKHEMKSFVRSLVDSTGF